MPNRLAFGGTALSLSIVGVGGRWLKPPLPPWVAYHGFREQCYGRISLHVSSHVQTRRTELPSCLLGEGSSPWDKEANECTREFYSIEIHLHRAPIPRCPPGWRGCTRAVRVPELLHHVTMYSSSRWLSHIS